MTRNLHARDDFEQGDIGYVRGHLVSKAPTRGDSRHGSLQNVKAGMNGWFDDHTTR
jgi:hypothetical protein